MENGHDDDKTPPMRFSKGDRVMLETRIDQLDADLRAQEARLTHVVWTAFAWAAVGAALLSALAALAVSVLMR